MNVIQLIPAHATIRPWHDPVVDARGHDPRSAYVERFWLSVIGPTATWIMRRFADEFDRRPNGFTLDLDHTASSMGLSFSKGQNSPFGKALHRCVMFGLLELMLPDPEFQCKVDEEYRHMLQFQLDHQALYPLLEVVESFVGNRIAGQKCVSLAIHDRNPVRE